MKHRLTYLVTATPGAPHVRLTVWVNGACAGHLIVREEEADVLHALVKALKANAGTEVR